LSEQFPTGPVSAGHPIKFHDALPSETDIVVIGGGIIGIASALYLTEEGFRVVVVEKGRIGAEQSSRNWGWIRQHGRDEDELPIMSEASRLWEDLDGQVKGRTGFRRGGIMYLASSEAEMGKHRKWLDVAKAHQLDTTILSKAEVAARINQGPSAHQWVGATFTPSDARAEPWQAVPALAEYARTKGVIIRENCAARTLEVTNGRITGVVSEDGAVKASQIVLAGGAWSSLFLRRHGVSIPQLSVRSSVSATTPMDEVFSGCAADEKLAFRRRADGGYTVSLSSLHDLYLGPDAFRHFFKWLPVAKKHWVDTRFRLNAPDGFPDQWHTKRQWGQWEGDEESPFERCRVLEPEPNRSKLETMRTEFARRFPQLGKPQIKQTWAGMIDAMPDIVPIVDRVPEIEGLILATGMSGHGFGIGPGYGKIIAKIAAGKSAGHDLSRFRFSRFSDGSRLRPGPAI